MIRLLMLDYDEHLTSAVTRALLQEGVEVVAVTTVAAARQALAQPFDVALLDSDLIDTAELAAFLHLPVILTTACLEPEGAHRFFQRARLLRKPFTNAQLLSALSETCGRPGNQQVGLVEMLRRAHSQRQSVALSVGRARLFVEAGELVHAELDGVSGERALAELLSEGAQAPLVTLTARAPARSIERPFQALMLDLLRNIEEREQRESELGRERRESSRPLRRGPRV